MASSLALANALHEVERLLTAEVQEPFHIQIDGTYRPNQGSYSPDYTVRIIFDEKAWPYRGKPPHFSQTRHGIIDETIREFVAFYRAWKAKPHQRKKIKPFITHSWSVDFRPQVLRGH